jgi:uncharacterized protein YcnI
MKRVCTIALATAVAGAALVVLAGPAFGHVTVTAPGATRGGSDQEITFRVPVEKNIDTVALAIELPTATPIASVLIDPVEGWTHTEKTSKLATPIKTDDGEITEAVTEISWKAQPGHGLAPGEFGEFTIIAGQLPDVATLAFGAVQTYSDGSVVNWNQVAAPGSTVEPDNPKPTLTLSAVTYAPPSAAPAASAASTSNTGPIVLSIIALVVAAAALGLAVVSRAKGAKD